MPKTRKWITGAEKQTNKTAIGQVGDHHRRIFFFSLPLSRDGTSERSTAFQLAIGRKLALTGRSLMADTAVLLQSIFSLG